MGNLTFNAELHEYRIDGIVIPSVTQILEAAGLSDVSRIPKDILERASNFGKAVHKAIELHCKGNLDMDSVDPILMLYLEAWKAFAEDFGYQFKRAEHRGAHPTYRYGFTIDQEGEITKGKYQGLAIGDIKTGQAYPSHKYQLNGGYKLAIGNANTFILYLNPEFKPRGYKVIFAVNNKRDQAVFLSALTLYNVRKEEGLL